MPRGRLWEILQEPFVEDGGESATKSGQYSVRHAESESAKAYCFSTSVSKRSAINFGSFRIVSKTRFKSALCEQTRVQNQVAPSL